MTHVVRAQFQQQERSASSSFKVKKVKNTGQKLSKNDIDTLDMEKASSSSSSSDDDGDSPTPKDPNEDILKELLERARNTAVDSEKFWEKLKEIQEELVALRRNQEVNESTGKTIAEDVKSLSERMAEVPRLVEAIEKRAAASLDFLVNQSFKHGLAIDGISKKVSPRESTAFAGAAAPPAAADVVDDGVDSTRLKQIEALDAKIASKTNATNELKEKIKALEEERERLLSPPNEEQEKQAEIEKKKIEQEQEQEELGDLNLYDPDDEEVKRAQNRAYNQLQDIDALESALQSLRRAREYALVLNKTKLSQLNRVVDGANKEIGSLKQEKLVLSDPPMGTNLRNFSDDEEQETPYQSPARAARPSTSNTTTTTTTTYDDLFDDSDSDDLLEVTRVDTPRPRPSNVMNSSRYSSSSSSSSPSYPSCSSTTGYRPGYRCFTPSSGVKKRIQRTPVSDLRCTS